MNDAPLSHFASRRRLCPLGAMLMTAGLGDHRAERTMPQSSPKQASTDRSSPAPRR
jgi:hypothetical protein